jgi:hypothetical protein
MRRMSMRWIAAASVPFAVGTAYAGAVVESTTQDVRSGKPVDTTVISAQGRSLRIERRSAVDPADRSLVLYVNDRLYVIDDATKAYRVMDRGSAATLDAARKAEAERIGADDAKPSSARAAKRTVAKPATKLVDAGRTQTVGEWACRTWNATVQGRVVAEYCVVPVAKLAGAQDLGVALQSFATFWQQVAADYPGLQDTGALARAFERTKGVPVQTKTFAAGKPQEIGKVTSIRSVQLGAAIFQVPAGYEQQNMVREAEGR